MAIATTEVTRFKDDIITARVSYCRDHAVACNSSGCSGDFRAICRDGVCWAEHMVAGAR